jgi:hypothetical protein
MADCSKREIPGAEIRHAHGAHLAAGHQRIQRPAGFMMVHQRVGAVDQQKVDAVGRQFAQAMPRPRR